MTHVPNIMGVVNVTPDSFSDGNRFLHTAQAVDHAHRLIHDGADILDIGGESTRPGAEPVSADEEQRRVLPVIEGIRSHHATIPISIDTMKAEVAASALASGATMVNDVTAGTHDPAMFGVVAQAGVPLVLMHMQGMPRTMQQAPTYGNVVDEVVDYLQQRVQAARDAGIQQVFVDPGIGFGKTLEHNLELLRNLDRIATIAPIVLGISRKRFLGSITGINEADQRDVATAIMHALLIHANVHTIRVHNVSMLAQLRALYQALRVGG